MNQFVYPLRRPKKEDRPRAQYRIHDYDLSEFPNPHVATTKALGASELQVSSALWLYQRQLFSLKCLRLQG